MSNLRTKTSARDKILLKKAFFANKYVHFGKNKFLAGERNKKQTPLGPLKTFSGVSHESSN
jgi:hypothetical protein